MRYIYTYIQNLQFVNIIILSKTEVNFLQALVVLPEFGSMLSPVGLPAPRLL
jgi:hypothetical protein